MKLFLLLIQLAYSKPSAPKDSLSNSDIKSSFEKLPTIFANLSLRRKTGLSKKGALTVDGETSLEKELEVVYETAIENSEIKNTEDSINLVRPYLAHALRILDVGFYEIDHDKLDKKINLLLTLMVRVLYNEKYQITDSAKDHMGTFFTQVSDSQLRSRLSLVEHDFDEFVDDLRLWCEKSLDSTFTAVKNIQKIVRSILTALHKLKQSANQHDQTDQTRMEVLQTIIEQILDIIYDKVSPISDSLMDDIEKLELGMNEGIKSVLKDAQDKVIEEYREYKLANATLFKNFKKTELWLARNEDKMLQIELDINENGLWLVKNDIRMQEEEITKIEYQESSSERAKILYNFTIEKIGDLLLEKRALLEKQSNLLIQKHNLIKGQELGKVYKSDFEYNLQEFQTKIDALIFANVSLIKVENFLETISKNFMVFKEFVKERNRDIEYLISDIEAIKYEFGKCDGLKYCDIGNIKNKLSSFLNETVQTGMSTVVLNRLYNTVYGYFTNVRKYPVGLYDPNSTVFQNIQKLQDSLKNKIYE